MKFLRLILLSPWLLYRLLTVEFNSLLMSVTMIEHFLKLIKVVKVEERPVYMELKLDGTPYVVWMGKYDNDIFTRLVDLSKERNELSQKNGISKDKMQSALQHCNELKKHIESYYSDLQYNESKFVRERIEKAKSIIQLIEAYLK